MDALRVYELLERLTAALRASEWASAKAHGLQPVHLHALHYLDRCNRYSDTPASVTAYLGATKGTVSQTLLVLEGRGYIEKRADTGDKRKVRLRVTKAGTRVLRACVPPPLLRDATKGEPAPNVEVALQTLLTACQHATGNHTFGSCKSCMHFGKGAFGKRHQCGLTGEELSDSDSMRICREHTLEDAVR